MPLKNCLVWVIKERFGKIAIYTLQNPTAKLHKISNIRKYNGKNCFSVFLSLRLPKKYKKV